MFSCIYRHVQKVEPHVTEALGVFVEQLYTRTQLCQVGDSKGGGSRHEHLHRRPILHSDTCVWQSQRAAEFLSNRSKVYDLIQNRVLFFKFREMASNAELRYVDGQVYTR